MLPLSELGARGTPAGTQIRSWAEASYEAPNGASFTVTSDTLVFTVAQVAGVDIEPPRTSVADPGVTALFSHTLVNVGNGTDSISVTASSRAGWPIRLYLDTDGDGTLDGGEPEISGPINLAADDTVGLLIGVDVPATAAVRGTVDTVDVQATSGFEPSTLDRVQDELTIRDVGVLVDLSKSVDRASATVGDILTYTITWSASGPNTASNLRILDPIPLGTSYVPGTLQSNGTPLTDAAGDDAGFFDVTANRVVFTLGNVGGGDAGTVSFQVRVDG